MKNTKYKLLKTDKVSFDGKPLFQIEALKDIEQSGIEKGERGGYITGEGNLDVSGNAWVYGNAQVSGNARVSGDARVYGNAWVYGNARVSGDAWVYGNARVSGDAWVYGNAWVYGDAWVYGNAWVYGDAWVYGKLKLEAGFFFGLRYKKEEIKFVDLDENDELIYKGNAKFGAEENEKKSELLKKAQELIDKANELKAEAEKI